MRPDDLFDSARYDLAGAPAPRLFYVICSTPRSGSNLLSTELWRSGAGGTPLEYFNFRSVMRQLRSRLGARNLAEYTERLFALRTTPNGVFGFKAHYDHFDYLSADPVFDRFEPLRFIYMERSDLVAQAVSLAMAFQTGEWTSFHLPDCEPSYSKALVDRALRQLQRQQAAWRELFEALEIEPFRVPFEELAADPTAMARRVMEWMGVEWPAAGPAIPVPPPLTKQESPHKKEWLRRYREETGKK